MNRLQYVEKLNVFLGSKHSVNRHAIFIHLSEPLRNLGLRNELSIPVPGMGFKLNSDVNKLIQSILGIWTSSDPFTACVGCISVFGSQIKQASETETSIVSVSVLVSFLQALSSLGRRLAGSSSLGSSQTLLDALRLEYAHLRRDAKTDLDKQVGMVICLIEIIKICIFDSSANPGIVDSLLASTQGILSFETDETVEFPKSVSTSYYFYLAKHLLFLDDFDGAREQLEKALNLTPTQPPIGSIMYRNKQRILWHLIPLKVAKGIFPTKKLLQTYPELDRMYRPILNAVRHRNLSQLRSILIQDKSFVNTFFSLFRTLENLVYRGVVREIWKISNETRRVDFSLFSEIMDNIDETLTEEILGNLIRQGFINGYISYEERALLLTGSNPFP